MSQPAGSGWAGFTKVDEVVDHAALGGDRAGVAEGLGAAGRRGRPVAGEVLVVDEDVAAVGPDEVGVVDVHAVGDERDLRCPCRRRWTAPAGVDGSRNAVFVTASASGSRRGLAGLAGQICDGSGPTGAWLEREACSVVRRGPALTSRSGKTAATAGSDASCVAWAAVTVAAMPFRVAKPRRFFAPCDRALAITVDWSARNALRRGEDRPLRAVRSVCWSRRTTMTFPDSPADARLGLGAANTVVELARKTASERPTNARRLKTSADAEAEPAIMCPPPGRGPASIVRVPSRKLSIRAGPSPGPYPPCVKVSSPGAVRHRSGARCLSPVAAGDERVGGQAAERARERQRRAVAALEREERVGRRSRRPAGRRPSARSIATRPGSAGAERSRSRRRAGRPPRTRRGPRPRPASVGRRSRIARQRVGDRRASPCRRPATGRRRRPRRAPSAPPGGGARTRRGRRRPRARRPASRRRRSPGSTARTPRARSRSIARTVRWK